MIIDIFSNELSSPPPFFAEGLFHYIKGQSQKQKSVLKIKI
jgi:hypothetical protein